MTLYFIYNFCELRILEGVSWVLVIHIVAAGTGKSGSKHSCFIHIPSTSEVPLSLYFLPLPSFRLYVPTSHLIFQGLSM